MRVERFFILVCIPAGIVLSLVTAPFQAPDEAAHFLRIWQLSEGRVVADHYGGWVPASLGECFTQFEYLKAHPNSKATFTAIRREFARTLDASRRQYLPFENTAIYSPVPYLPQLAAVWLGRQMSLPPIALMYLGRCANALAFASLGWLTLRTLPILKIPACLVLLAPLPLFLAGSLSADPLTIGFTFLFTAATLRAHFSGLTHSTVGLLALSAIGTALCKWSYFPVVILMFGLLRGQSVKPAWHTRTVFVPVVIAALVVLVSVVWARLADPSHVMLRNTDPLGQVHWITAHPLEYVHVLTRTALEDGGNIFVSTLWTLGWLDVHLSHLFILAYTLVIGWAVVNDPEAMRLKIQFRLLAAAAVTIAALLIATCVFVAWDGFGQHSVEGIQGRYFIPLMLCGFVCARRSSQRPLPTAALQGIVFFSGLYTVAAVIYRYYLQ